MTFTVRIVVRGYELDVQGHLNSAVYHQYGEKKRRMIPDPGGHLRSLADDPSILSL
jgi:acyl-CoA thioesterase FadM